MAGNQRAGALSGMIAVMVLGVSACGGGGGGDDGGGTAGGTPPDGDQTPQGTPPNPPAPTNSPPSITGQPLTRVLAGTAYDFTPVVTDPDGDTLSLTISNAPAWASFDPGTGRLAGTPQAEDVGVYTDIKISVSDGTDTDSLADFDIEVQQPNGAPTISGTPPALVVVGGEYSFSPVAIDPEDDTLTFSAENLPSWATLDALTGALTGTPQPGDEGVYAGIVLSVSDGELSASLQAFQIVVEGENRAPTISGTAPAEVFVGANYVFQPVADDADGDTLVFGAQNLPLWATLDAATGRVSGVPGAGDEGVYDGIVLSVSDGELSAQLAPFRIVVAQPNLPPFIAGTPADQVLVGEGYLFQPTANDPDGDTLAFSVENLPAWATFDESTGRVSGSPRPGDEGQYAGITISVSDGSLSTFLAPFSITVEASVASLTLSWTAPTENTDGSPLTDLAGYRIYYGTAPGVYGPPIVLDNEGLASYVLEDLTAGVEVFVSMTAVNEAGFESALSNEVSAVP